MLMCLLLLTLPALVSAADPAAPTWASTPINPDKYVDGTEVALTCAHADTSGSVTLSFKFVKTGGDGTSTDVTPTAGESTVAAGVLTFTSYSEATHGGVYTCVASNTDGTDGPTDSATTQTLETHVVKPTLVQEAPANDAQYADGDTVSIKCETSTATAAYSFYKDGAVTADSGTGGVLTFTTYSAATHAGKYKCRATKDTLYMESDELTVGNSAVQMMTPMIILPLCLLVTSFIY